MTKALEMAHRPICVDEHAGQLDEHGVLGLEVGLGQRVRQKLVGERLDQILLRLEKLRLEAL